MSCERWLLGHKGAVLADWLVAVGTMAAAATALFGYKLAEWRRRRNDSILGVAIVKMLLEEVRDGVSHMKELKRILETEETAQRGDMCLTIPHAGWEGLSTIPDSVLLRVIATAKYEDTKPRHFHPCDVRTQTKGYYEHIVSAVARVQTSTEILGLIEPKPGKGYIAIAEAIAYMLEETKGLLERNAERWFPK